MKSIFRDSHKKAYVTRQSIARSYQALSTLTDRLPWRDYNEEHKCILLEDNESLGVCFKIEPIACEARPDSMMDEISKSISEAIKNSIPCEKENPWVLQVYIQKRADLSQSYKAIEDYFPESRKHALITKEYLSNLKEHFDYMTQPGGIFHDSQVTNLQFRGGEVAVFAALYRRIKIKKNKQDSRRTHLEEMTRVSRKFTDQLCSCGMKVQRMEGNDFYQWMRRWFNSKENLSLSFPDKIQKPIGYDLAEQLFCSTPESFEEGWVLDGTPHKVITIQNMTTNPAIGHISAERKRNVDDKIFNLIDHLPEESIFAVTVIMQAPSEVALHLKGIHESAVGNHALAEKVKNEVSISEKFIADGDYLLPVMMSLYLKGDTFDDLRAKEAYAEVLLNSNGFKAITDDELFPADAYLRNLPMCYDFQFDRHNSYRSRYILLSDIAKLLPFYGRSRGTGHPGIILFNRGGEPWTYDLMADKTKNAHLLVLGETGTGKSNLLNFMITHDLALYHSRFFIIEAGGSFDLLGEYCKTLGLSVNKIKIDPNNPVSLNPFSNGLRILEQLEAFNSDNREKFITTTCDKLIQEQEDNRKKDNLSDDEAPRDILGDMMLAALIMITGGEKREEEAIRRSDRMLIMDAIIDAAYYVRDQKREQMIAGDIVEAFERLALKLDPKRDDSKIRRANEMADSMRYFTKDPVSSQFFNSYGNPWEPADITIIDLGLFAREGYEAHRSIAFSSCMNHILSLAEVNQNKDRAIKIVCDENHIISSIPLLSDIETRVAKMGRKLGLWLWLATQNMRDFADGARRMLSQIETWICLALPLDEIHEIERFKTLSSEQRALFLSAQKEKGKYTEGVFLSPKIRGLFRNIPPRLYLAMAATDQDEKSHRAKIMREHKCSEIDAVKIIAKQMMNRAGK